MGSLHEDEKENIEPVQQQWIIKPSPKKHDSFSLDDSHLSIATSSDSETDSNTHTTTPKKQGILRLASTPATGQSVRFGKRLYDDGDESKMSNSTANSSTILKSQLQEPSEDAIEMSLGFIRSPRKSQSSPERRKSGQNLDDLDDDSDQVSPDASTNLQASEERFGDLTSIHQSIDTIAMPSLEGYSNIDDISLDFPLRDDTTVATFSRPKKSSRDSFEDMSFNESFLQAEIELAKRCMEEDEGNTDPANRPHTEDPTSEATVLVRSQSEEEIENETTTIIQGTPMGANSTHGSEYLSTRSQVSTHSPSSTVSQWNTPRSVRFSPVESIHDEAKRESEDASSTGVPFTGEESPSAQRLQRRVSVRSALPSPSPLFARLKSLTNTPIKRSPLSNVVLPPGAFSRDDTSMASVMMSDSDAKTHSVFSRSTCTTPSKGDSVLSSSTSSIIEEIIRETDELDQVHSERSEVLLQWIQEAEQESQQTQKLLEEEIERCTAALQEVEAAQISMQSMKEEAVQLEVKRSKRLKEVEELAAKLHSQLEGRSNVDEQSKGAAENSSVLDSEERVAELEGIVRRQKEELERIQSIQEDEKAEVYGAQLQREEENQTQEDRFEKMKKHYHERELEKEAAYHSLQMQLEAIENSREGKLGDEEEERINLHRQLIESREEQKALQDALISAQKQIGALQGEDYKDNEALARTRNEVVELQRQLNEVQTALQESRCREQNASRAIEENSKTTSLTLEEERFHWSKKYEQMESENDNLLQSLAEAEEHRRTMEDDLLQKRDVALQESKVREEQALSLAEEMQGRLEKVESKLQAMTSRTTMLEHEVGDRGLQLVKLERAKERLEEDNLNYGIALSSKQQELSLLKRNTNRNLRNTPASAVSVAPRSSGAFPSHTLNAYSRNPLKEIQAADESGSSLAPLQAGPVLKTMRRKTMDVNTTSARTVISSARVMGGGALARNFIAMPPPPSTVKLQRPTVDRQKSPEEGIKVNGPPSRTSSRSSQRSSITMQTSLRSAPSRRSSSSSSMTLQQVRPALSSSILASEGPMDISELQMDRQVSKVQQSLQSIEAPRARAPVTIPSRARSSVII